MPLTVPAHQVLVLPFVRGGKSPLPGAALLLGTALPDLAFCVGGYRLNELSHLWWGPLFLSPTLGLLLYAWTEALFLPALANALPAHGRLPVARLCATRGLPESWRGWAWTLFALVLGSYTHLFFDGWTHASMWPARVLYPDVHFKIAGMGVVGFAHGLQGLSSAIASVVVLLWVHRALRRAPLMEGRALWRRGLGLLLGATIAGGALGYLVGVGLFGWPHDSRTLVLLVMSPMSVGAFVGGSIACWRLLRAPMPFLLVP
jgi:Domain of unknown function (DUF4184)